MVNDRQQRMGHGNYSPLFATAASQSAVLGLEVGVLFSGRSPGGLRQGRTQPTITLGGLAALAFARTFIVAGADTRPRRQMLRRWKGVHVSADLRHHVLGGPLIKTRQGRNLGYGRGERAAH